VLVSLTPEQLEQRRGLITASDAASILGLNPWKSAADVWAEKVHGGSAFRGNYKTRRGHAIEPLLLEWLGEKKSPLLVTPSGATTLTHPLLPWLGATPDALVHTTRQVQAFDVGPVVDVADELVAIGEAKSSGAVEHWTDEDGEPKIPDYYHPQVVVQMAVTGAPRAFVVAEILTERGPEAEPWIIEVERDAGLEAIVLEELEEFQRLYLKPRVCPPLDDASYRQIANVFRRPQRAELVAADARAEDLARQYLEAQATKKAAEERAEQAKAELCKLIGDAEGVHGDTWKASWKWRDGGPVSFVREGYRHFDLRAVGVAAKKKGRAA
jgi:putative phage-type endonuclease